MKTIIYALFCVFLALAVHAAIAQTWTSMNGPQYGTANIQDLAAASSTTLYEIQGTSIYYSSNSGASWAQASSPAANRTPLAITCRQSSPAYVVTAAKDASSYGYVYYSTDNGTNWTQELSSTGQPNRIASSPVTQTYMLLGTQKLATYSSLYRSVDGGLNWIEISIFDGTGSNYKTHITALNWDGTSADRVLAGGTKPTSNDHHGVFKSTNAGVDWVSVGPDSDITAIASYLYNGNTYVFAAASGGSLYYSNTVWSASTGWAKRANMPGGVIKDLQTSSGGTYFLLYAATTTGFYQSTDLGVTWSGLCQVGFYNQHAFTRASVDPQDADNIFAGSESNLYISTDQGSSWNNAAPSPSNISVTTVGVQGTYKLANPSSGSFLERNQGSGWNQVNLPSCVSDFVGNMIGFKTGSSTTVFNAGYHSTGGSTALLYISTDRGENWTEKISGSCNPGQYNGIAVDPYNTDRVYAFGLKQNNYSGSNENVSFSNNSGSTWGTATPIPNNSNSAIPEVVDMVIDTTGHGQNQYSQVLYAAVNTSTSDSGAYKSTDAASNWSKVLSNRTRALALNPVSGSTVYAAGPVGMKKTTNGGTNWSALNSAPASVTRIAMHPSHPNSSNYLWVVAGNGQTVYKTTNGGSDWTDVTGSVPIPIYDFRRDPANDSLFYAATGSGVYKINPNPEAPIGFGIDGTPFDPCMLEQKKRSVNSGNVMPNSLGPPNPCYPIPYWSANVESDIDGYEIFRLIDDGDWELLATVNSSTLSYTDYGVTSNAQCTGSHQALYKVRAIDKGGHTSSFSVAYGVVAYSVPLNKSHSVIVSGEKPSVYQLWQNAPNPFNPTTTIQYDLVNNEYVRLAVYDMLGRSVRVLVDEPQSAGRYNVKLDASNLSSGIYFYRIQAGKFNAVKKMLLLK
jgi:photosystem II stability/assembly factor-like uncharacterized protein